MVLGARESFPFTYVKDFQDFKGLITLLKILNNWGGHLVLPIPYYP